MASEVPVPNESKSATSSEVVGYIDDLLIKILLKLPVKSIIRFKLVSKHWESLISSPRFYHLHDTDPIPAVGVFYRDPDATGFEYIDLNVKTLDSPPIKEFSFLEDPDLYWIQQSCNGLLVFCGNANPVFTSFSVPVEKCYIFNPTTNQLRRIPIEVKKDGHVYGVALAFDRKKSPPYKVVSIVTESFTDRFQIEIYSSESGVWSVAGEPFISGVDFNHAVYWNGAIHWVNYRSGELLYFNVEDETLGRILRLDRDEDGHIEYFGESCDRLLLIEGYKTKKSVNVYEMKMDYSEWFVKYQVDLSILGTSVPDVAYINSPEVGIFYEFAVLTLVLDKDGENPFVVLHNVEYVVKFSFRSQSVEIIYELKQPTGEPYSYIEQFAADYVRSLAPV